MSRYKLVTRRQTHCRFCMDGSGIKQWHIGVLLLNQ